MRPKRYRFTSLLGGVLLAALAACGSSSDDANGSGATTAGESTADATTAAETATTAATTAAGSGETATFPVTIDAANGEVSLEAQPGAIVSLSPTATEMLFAIGAGPQVTAVDDQSNYPAEAPVTELSGFEPNVEAIAAKQPDLVVVADDTAGLTESLGQLGIPCCAAPICGYGSRLGAPEWLGAPPRPDAARCSRRRRPGDRSGVPGPCPRHPGVLGPGGLLGAGHRTDGHHPRLRRVGHGRGRRHPSDRRLGRGDRPRPARAGRRCDHPHHPGPGDPRRGLRRGVAGGLPGRASRGRRVHLPSRSGRGRRHARPARLGPQRPGGRRGRGTAGHLHPPPHVRRDRPRPRRRGVRGRDLALRVDPLVRPAPGLVRLGPAPHRHHRHTPDLRSVPDRPGPGRGAGSRRAAERGRRPGDPDGGRAPGPRAARAPAPPPPGPRAERQCAAVRGRAR